MVLEQGSRLGGFTILGEIGRDATGVLYRARQTERNRLVALRVLEPEVADDEGFLSKARRSIKIRHKNIQRLHLFGKAGELRFLAHEYAPGLSLRRRLESREAMDPYHSLKVIRRVTRALRIARQSSLRHADLRPCCILVSESGSVKVTGIGMPRDADRDSALFATGRGKIPFYSPPEDLYEGADPDDERRTVFTLGAILYHMLAGRPPMFGETLREALTNHADHGIEALELVRPGLPLAVTDLVGKMLQPPPLRYQSLEEVSAAIRSAMRMLRGDTLEEIECSDPSMDI